MNKDFSNGNQTFEYSDMETSLDIQTKPTSNNRAASPGSSNALQKVRKQLQDEYKYVDGLRKNLRIAESR